MAKLQANSDNKYFIEVFSNNGTRLGLLAIEDSPFMYLEGEGGFSHENAAAINFKFFPEDDVSVFYLDQGIVVEKK